MVPQPDSTELAEVRGAMTNGTTNPNDKLLMTKM